MPVLISIIADLPILDYINSIENDIKAYFYFPGEANIFLDSFLNDTHSNIVEVNIPANLA